MANLMQRSPALWIVFLGVIEVAILLALAKVYGL